MANKLFRLFSSRYTIIELGSWGQTLNTEEEEQVVHYNSSELRIFSMGITELAFYSIIWHINTLAQRPTLCGVKLLPEHITFLLRVWFTDETRIKKLHDVYYL